MQSRRSILLLDDEPELVMLFDMMLKKAGYGVAGFTNPIEALQDFRLKHDRYALAISDIRMPAMSGFEFVRQIKSIDDQVKVILMTAFEVQRQEFDIVFPTTKVDELVEKPIPIQKLMQTVAKYAGATQPH